jgi:glycosyltransferase involved in cell wall biosynthesis
MKILAINQYYDPDVAVSGQILTSLCEGLAEEGFELTVICGKPSYTEDAIEALSFEQKPNLRIHRVGTAGAKGRASMSTRVTGYLGFGVTTLCKLIRFDRREKYDVIMTFSNPPFVGIYGAWFKRKWQSRFLYVLHDLHPDILIRMGWVKEGLLTRLWDRVNKYIFDRADRIVVLTPNMKQYLSIHKEIDPDKLMIIPNWSVEAIIPGPRENYFRQEYGLGAGFLVLYAGNMGIMHNLEWLLDSAREMQGQDIWFVFVGSGDKLPYLQSEAEKYNLTNVRFLPYQPQKMINEMLCAADVCVIALESQAVGLAFPSKTYPILAGGRPILALATEGDDLDLLVKGNKCGWSAYQANDVSTILASLLDSPQLLSQAGINARMTYETMFTKQSAIKEYIKILKDLEDNRQ